MTESKQQDSAQQMRTPDDARVASAAADGEFDSRQKMRVGYTIVGHGEKCAKIRPYIDAFCAKSTLTKFASPPTNTRYNTPCTPIRAKTFNTALTSHPSLIKHTVRFQPDSVPAQ